ncbi:hypothetical protein [Vogesella sp. LIG4]|uniref:hypothetical protein n=1 Tax=Vogesella sp. LIG4 TaxID=1192162 RepID=UPI0012FD31BE|nr:hypothetical protein [Vogesella sp. LIG4]
MKSLPTLAGFSFIFHPKNKSDLGVNVLQGYFFSRPISPAHVKALACFHLDCEGQLWPTISRWLDWPGSCSAKAVDGRFKEIWPVLFTDRPLPFFLGHGCLQESG